jgi:TRAP-type C4-dicarboxylate transport system permease small subunit
MTIDPAFDKWVWLSFLGLLIVLGVRAWVVESSRGRVERTPTRVRALTAASVCVVAVVVALLAIQGGRQAVHSVLTRTDPITGLPLDQPKQPAPAAPAPAAPNANQKPPAAGGAP